MASEAPLPSRLLIGSTLGLLGGLFMFVVGRSIIDATKAGTYETVIGLTVITGLMATTGLVITLISFLGLIIGVWQSVRRGK